MLGAGTRVVFDTLTQYGPAAMVDTRVRLERGRGWSIVGAPGGRRGRYRLLTPAATAVARGTEFRVEVDGASQVTDVETLEGTIAAAGGGAEVTVSAGFATQVRPAEAPSPPVALLAAPGFDSPPPVVRRLPVRLDLPEVAGASAYRVEVSQDPTFQTYAYESTSPSRALRGPDLPDGSYSLRVRGVDGRGLEGRDAVTTLIVDARPEPPVLMVPAPGATLADERPRLRWTEAAGAAAYHLQIATTDRFDAPLTADVAVSAGASFSPDTALPPGEYFWRVATRSASGERGPFGDAQAFTRRERPAAPGAETQVRAGQVALRWASGHPGARYRYQIARDREFSALVAESVVDAPMASVPGLGQGRYFLRIKAIEADGVEGDYGTVQAFDVAAPEPQPRRRRWPLIVVPAAAGLLLLLLL